MGVNPRRHLTREAWDVLHHADRVFVESYTSIGPAGWQGVVAECAKVPVEHLSREQVEAGKEILEAARKGS
ncbi:MAG TPA: hypothetical protein VI893_11005, partial [Thermoplasmata archaeon]|nr:hypothetical protein [Thermoplasmata archaeon]